MVEQEAVRLREATIDAIIQRVGREGDFAWTCRQQLQRELSALLDRIEALEGALSYLEDEARRFAGHYPEGSDGRNTFVIFADKIAARILNGASNAE